MATTTYEEEKKRVERPADYVAQTYAPPTPTATYAGSDSEAMINAIRQRYSEVADPRRQAEEDARIQRGRQFWTGANLFANVIANAINANGTANNAPNMTWNNEMERNMYATWRDADKQLRADRREAQQRYDAMTLQDAQMRLNDKQAADKAALDAYNRNFAAQQEADKINYNNQWNDYHQQQADDRQLEKEQREDEKWRERNEITHNQNLQLARIRHSGSGGGRSASTKPATEYSISLGSIDIPAKDKNEALRIQKDIANKIVERMNRDIEARNKGKGITEKKEDLIAKPKNPTEAGNIIYQYGDMYDNGDYDDFRKEINKMYGIEDIYNEPEPAPQPKYQMPTYTPSWEVPAQQTQQTTQAPAQQSAARQATTSNTTASSASGSRATGQRHWMDTPLGEPYPHTPGYLTSKNQPTNTQGNPWKFPKKK